MEWLSSNIINSDDHRCDENFHKSRKQQYKKAKKGSSYDTVPFIDKEDKTFWRKEAQKELETQLGVRPRVTQAKNVILFLGDGMSVATVTAARIMKGQKTGKWEHQDLAWETFPYSAIIKTYTADSQVADSAASATAYLCGVKNNRGTIGVDVNVNRENCSAQHDPTFHTHSIAKWFQDGGKSTGFVTTTRVTHATPAGVYAHIADREWEDDHEITADGLDAEHCDDIAEQLILNEPGRNFKVIMGGGRRVLTPSDVLDVEESRYGFRKDGKNLINMWIDDKASRGVRASYVWNRDDLLALDTSKTDYLLGLFGYSHMDYVVERDSAMDPSLPEMTKAALEVLQKDPNGYFLLVEGGLIDLGHHGNKVQKALSETVEMAEAVQVAVSMTSQEDTLVVVTADHGHSLTINGYPTRHTDILGIGDISSEDFLPYTTLLYGNGPGFQPQVNGHRPDVSKDDLMDVNYRHAASVPLDSAAHTGDDVGLYAIGPHAHLFTGVHEQSYIPYALAYAACVGDGLTFCGSNRFRRNHGLLPSNRGQSKLRQRG
ncbi:alkaline phosphatase-like isoform X2 [Cherax quadricarinatus]|uniref:alkaline phosphatase-like isoform X2 n=1 Tax=Cherax quadricarinatus TaxID=27406 RepID=UPI00387ED961